MTKGTIKASTKNADDDSRQRIVVYFPTDLAKKLRHHCVEKGSSLTDVVTEAVKEFLRT